jgi:hypothetical protein
MSYDGLQVVVWKEEERENKERNRTKEECKKDGRKKQKEECGRK